ncbi:Hpt domain-containing protein [Actinoplanes sp. NPDC024001]|uniref:Hpt domain-containing protein n=1 Tax=Actinoplanes sp. NPDC024001 TaxID=3154598 RepID=UPI00340F213C
MDDDSRVAAVRARLAEVIEDDPSPAEIALVRRLLHSFASKAPDAAGLLAALLRDGDPGRVRDQAHTLKGSAANIGATALADLCLAVEDQARAGTIADPADTTERLRTEVAAALRAVAVVAGEYESLAEVLNRSP